MASKLHNKLVTRKSPAKKQKAVPVRIVHDEPVATSKYADEDKKWRAQSDLRTLQKAEEIRSNKTLMRAAKTEAKAQIKALSSVGEK